jgi:hypothetical protein
MASITLGSHFIRLRSKEDLNYPFKVGNVLLSSFNLDLN